MRHDPLRLASPRGSKFAFFRAPLCTVIVPIPHHLVHPAAVYAADQAANLLDEVTKERGAWRKRHVVDVAVQRLVHAKDELRHIEVSFQKNQTVPSVTRSSSSCSNCSPVPLVLPEAIALSRASLEG